jgi:DNA recombination protein RmuC
VRGRWGEMQLRRVAELSGMSAHCDFTEQVSIDTEKGRLRPDMIVHLPMEREIVVDAKVSLDAYLAGIEAATEEERRASMERHAQQVRAHMVRLASKEYWAQFERSPEFVVLFIPGESFLGAALDCDAALLEDGMTKKIVLATPTTFIALLKAVAYGWQQEQLACNAKAISDLGKELYDRIAVMVGHLNDMGSGLRKANDSFNRAVGSMESRVLPSVRRFRDLGVPASADVASLEPVDRVPRSIEPAEEEAGRGRDSD